jgi:hypothetical protein
MYLPLGVKGSNNEELASHTVSPSRWSRWVEHVVRMGENISIQNFGGNFFQKWPHNTKTNQRARLCE